MESIINLNGVATGWLPQDGNADYLAIPTRHTVEGVERYCAVHLQTVNEFDLSSEAGVRWLQEAYHSQHTGFRAIHTYLTEQSDDFTMELRLEKKTDNLAIDCYLLFRVLAVDNNPADLSTKIDVIEQLLPDGYWFSPLSASSLHKLLENENPCTRYEVHRRVQLIPCGNFESLYKTRAKVPPLGTMKLQFNEHGNRKATYGFDEAFTYLAPALEYLEGKTTLSMTDVFDALNRVNASVQVRLLLGVTKVSAYDKAMASQFFDLLQGTYRENVLLPNSTVDRYLKAYQAILYQPSLPVFQAFVQSSDESAAAVVATTLKNHLGGAYQLGKRTADPGRSCTLQFHSFDQFPKLWHQEAEPFLERLQYFADYDEIHMLFKLPLAETTRSIPFHTTPFSPFAAVVTPAFDQGDTIPLGVILEKGAVSERRYSFPIHQLNKHALISGVTGSGKSETTKKLARQLIQKDVPILMFEPIKSEYFADLAAFADQCGKEIHYFQVSEPFLKNGDLNPTFLRFNPLIPVKGISMQLHLSYMHACLTSAYPMYGISSYILQDCLHEFLKIDEFTDPELKTKRRKRGLSEKEMFDARFSATYFVDKQFNGDPVIFPANNDAVTLKAFTQFVGQYLEAHADHFDPKMRSDLESTLTRRLMLLGKKVLGQILCPENWRTNRSWSTIPNHIDTILHKNCIIDLQGLPDNESKALIMSFLFTYLYEDRLQRKSHDPQNTLHVTFIEEAHRVLSASSIQRPTGGENASQSPTAGTAFVDLFTQALSELRAKNEGFVLIEQSSSKLVSDIVKLTNIKLMHRLTSMVEREYLGKAMNLDPLQLQFAANLKPGHAIAFSEDYTKPQLIYIDRNNH